MCFLSFSSNFHGHFGTKPEEEEKERRFSSFFTREGKRELKEKLIHGRILIYSTQPCLFVDYKLHKRQLESERPIKFESSFNF